MVQVLILKILNIPAKIGQKPRNEKKGQFQISLFLSCVRTIRIYYYKLCFILLKGINNIVILGLFCLVGIKKITFQ